MVVMVMMMMIRTSADTVSLTSVRIFTATRCTNLGEHPTPVGHCCRGQYYSKLRFRSHMECTVTIQLKAVKLSGTSTFRSLGNKSSAVAEMGDRLATIDVGRKVGELLCPSPWGVGSPSNTMSPGPRPTSVPSGILIHPTV